jgi:hypothetical protein
MDCLRIAKLDDALNSRSTASVLFIPNCQSMSVHDTALVSVERSRHRFGTLVQTVSV